MAWTVRTEDGALEFQSLGDVERAYRLGLVEPGDELREHGGQTWRRAGDHPALRNAAPKRKSGVPRQLWVGTALAVVLAGVALALMARGQWALALGVAAAVSLFLLRFNRRVAIPAATARPAPRRLVRS